MERESFSTPEVAEILNNNFIPVKIDKDERPDIDHIYMNYVHATTGTRGYPLNVFITPELEPVFGGTYWRGPSYSMLASPPLVESIGFMDILMKVKDAWKEQQVRCRNEALLTKQQLLEFAEEGVHGHDKQTQVDGGNEDDELTIVILKAAFEQFERRYDKIDGGFSIAPKFPNPVHLSFLLRLGQWPSAVTEVMGNDDLICAKSMALTTLRRIARSGIRDQIGDGFSRSSVTKDWSLPQFEKLLCDQAQLLSVYLDAFLLTRDLEMLGAVSDTSTYLTHGPLLRPDFGCFYSSEAADSPPTSLSSEKSEGAFYVWTYNEVLSIVGPQNIDIVASFYGISPDGNIPHSNDPHDEFINKNVLRVTTTPVSLAQEVSKPVETVVSILLSARQMLREHRNAHRPHPSVDEKIITSWNSLTISALARTAAGLFYVDEVKSSRCLEAALSAKSFIFRKLFNRTEDIVYRFHSTDSLGLTNGFCEDYAYLIAACIDLYEATFNDAHLQDAELLQKLQLRYFWDEKNGGFFSTPDPQAADLLLRLKLGMDSSEPSSNNISALNLFRLGSMLDNPHYTQKAKETVQAFAAEIQKSPMTCSGLLGSVVTGELGVQRVILTGKEVDDKVLAKLRSQVRPGRVVVRIDEWSGWEVRKNSAFLMGFDVKKQAVIIHEGDDYWVGGIEMLDEI